MYKYSGRTVVTKIFRLIKTKFDALSKVATSGSYADLSNKPSLVKGTTEVASQSSTINLPFTATSVNGLLVFHNGILLTENTHYTATTTKITLKDYTASVGDVFTFVNMQ